jgi:chromosome segregation ATPase
METNIKYGTRKGMPNDKVEVLGQQVQGYAITRRKRGHATYLQVRYNEIAEGNFDMEDEKNWKGHTYYYFSESQAKDLAAYMQDDHDRRVAAFEEQRHSEAQRRAALTQEERDREDWTRALEREERRLTHARQEYNKSIKTAIRWTEDHLHEMRRQLERYEEPLSLTDSTMRSLDAHGKQPETLLSSILLSWQNAQGSFRQHEMTNHALSVKMAMIRVARLKHNLGMPLDLVEENALRLDDY